MKTSYLQRNRRESRLKKVGLVLGIFLLGALLFSFLEAPIVSLVSPIWRAENAATRFLVKIGESWKSRQSLIKENAELKQRIASMELEASAMRLSVDNERALFELLGRNVERKGIVSSVLTHPPQSPYDLIVIDAGERDGVTIGSMVALPEGPVLGRVSDVFSTSAKVRLFSTSEEKTNAVLERYNLPVILEGQGGGNFRIELPRDTEVEVGDRIISADMAGKLMAVVGEIRVEPTASFKEVLAKSPANVFSVRFVTILP